MMALIFELWTWCDYIYVLLIPSGLTNFVFVMQSMLGYLFPMVFPSIVHCFGQYGSVASWRTEWFLLRGWNSLLIFPLRLLGRSRTVFLLQVGPPKEILMSGTCRYSGLFLFSFHSLEFRVTLEHLSKVEYFVLHDFIYLFGTYHISCSCLAA